MSKSIPTRTCFLNEGVVLVLAGVHRGGHLSGVELKPDSLEPVVTAGV
ncbi:hypothetical protein ABZV60_33995 [Streptomyces sp. NPDC004787]